MDHLLRTVFGRAAGLADPSTVILDPAKLTRDRNKVVDALKKYFAMNRLALDVIPPGGLLLTCSCTGLVSEATHFLPHRPLQEAKTATGGSFHSNGQVLVLKLAVPASSSSSSASLHTK